MTMTNNAVPNAIAATIAADVATDNVLAARLRHPRADVASALRVAVEKGAAIQARRIRYQEDLDEARSLKLKWTQALTDLLNALFDGSAVADYCNDWVGRIFPEYAELGNFIEQFHEEMDYRLAKLRLVLKRVEQVAGVEPAGKPAATSQSAANEAPAVVIGTAPAAAAVAPVVTHPGAPVRVPGVVLFGPKDHPTHSAAVELLKRLNVTVKLALEAPGAGSPTDAAVFVITSQPSDPGAARVALFELGCAVGRLGSKRVCVLHPIDVPAPFADTPVTHIPADAGGGWHLTLLRHLKQAGMDVDLNKLC
jgi:hypothetical protein